MKMTKRCLRYLSLKAEAERHEGTARGEAAAERAYSVWMDLSESERAAVYHALWMEG